MLLVVAFLSCNFSLDFSIFHFEKEKKFEDKIYTIDQEFSNIY